MLLHSSSRHSLPAWSRMMGLIVKQHLEGCLFHVQAFKKLVHFVQFVLSSVTFFATSLWIFFHLLVRLLLIKVKSMVSHSGFHFLNDLFSLYLTFGCFFNHYVCYHCPLSILLKYLLSSAFCGKLKHLTSILDHASHAFILFLSWHSYVTRESEYLLEKEHF